MVFSYTAIDLKVKCMKLFKVALSLKFYQSLYNLSCQTR